MTRGATDETVDGMDLQKIHNIIDLLKQERYVWTPVRRTEIPKANGKTRPLGIPTWSDKLVQEVLRSILEPYYEQRFSHRSHGFRPDRGCHSALREIRDHWTGTTWFIEGDIKGCFDNIDHTVLLDIIRRNIHDGRLMRLIDGLLKAGYMEDWKYHETASGTPQGGIISPFLSNVYLDQLDKYVSHTLIPAYTKGKRRRSNPEYDRINHQILTARRRGDGDAINRLKRERRDLMTIDPMDPGYRRLQYVRYADDFLLGLAGHKDEAEAIRDQLAEYLRDHLKLDLSIEKTLVTNAATDKAKFLGYEVTVTRGDYIAPNGTRRANGKISLLMPRKPVEKILANYSREGTVRHRSELEPEDDYTIITRYQSVLRGLYNYYCMATNVSKRMGRIKYILEISLTKTLACKHRLTVPQVYRKYEALNRVDNLKMLELIVERPGKEPLIATFGGFPLRRKPQGLGIRDFQPELAWNAPGSSRSEIVQRLLHGKCELCGADDPTTRIAMHHIRALKDLKRPGQAAKAPWKQIMSARKRKSLAVCTDCHKAIHAGRYDGPSPAKFTGEPDAVKAARPVRGGAAGKGADHDQPPR
jgi:group II intron reverse transcriptase/maturase